MRSQNSLCEIKVFVNKKTFAIASNSAPKAEFVALQTIQMHLKYFINNVSR